MKKQKKKRKLNHNVLKNIIFVIIVLVIILIILLLSSNVKKNDKDNEKLFSFSASEFPNVTSIGVNEYEASFSYEGTSIIFFCSNEKRNCFDELSDLNSVAAKTGVGIEYINVLELVDSEKQTLKDISDIFNNNFYPNLVIIKNGEIVNNINTYLNEDEILDLFRDYEIIE